MPGLIGIIDHRAHRPLPGIISRMVEAMRREDWYQVDRFEDGGVAALGRVPLGIFNPERQPAIDATRNLAVFLDGELSNGDELKRELAVEGQPIPAGDATLALLAYRQWGKEFVDHLEGSFTVLVWDGPERELVAANDRFGLRPLYYAENRGSLLLASEGKAILADGEFLRKLDYDGFACLLRFGWIVGDGTLFEGIRLLPPASIMTYGDGQLRIRRYWFPPKYLLELRDRETIPEREFLEFIRYSFNRAVEKSLKGNYRVGLFLTGGLDSRTILSAVPDGREVPCLTFFGVPNSTDQLIAEEAAKLAGQPHFAHDFGPEVLRNFAEESVRVTEGMLPATECHGLAPVGWAKEHAEVILSGWGGETIRAGWAGGSGLWRIPRYAFSTSDHERMKSFLFDRLIAGFVEPELRELLSPECFGIVEGRAAKCFERVFAVSEECPSAWDRSDYFFLLDASRRKNIFGLVFLNTAIEHRAPFADYRFVDALTSVPHSLHRKAPYSVVHRYILKANCLPLAELKEYTSGMRASTSIYRLALRGFVNGLRSKRILWRLPVPRYRARFYLDYGAWMREQLRDYVVEALLDKRTLSLGYFNEATIRRLVDDHMNGRANAATKLGILLGFELWHRLFLD